MSYIRLLQLFGEALLFTPAGWTVLFIMAMLVILEFYSRLQDNRRKTNKKYEEIRKGSSK